jgi:hypothetical protein
MAKRNQQVAPKQLEDILNEAIDLTNNQHSYVNNIRMRVTNNEVTIDCYFLAGDPKNPPGKPIAYRSHRLVLPLSLAKDIGQLLVNSLASWEEVTGVTLPIVPKNTEENNHDDD